MVILSEHYNNYKKHKQDYLILQNNFQIGGKCFKKLEDCDTKEHPWYNTDDHRCYSNRIPSDPSFDDGICEGDNVPSSFDLHQKIKTITNSLEDNVFVSRILDLSCAYLDELKKWQIDNEVSLEQERFDLGPKKSPLGTLLNLCRSTSELKEKMLNINNISPEERDDVLETLKQMKIMQDIYISLLKRDFSDIAEKELHVYSTLSHINWFKFKEGYIELELPLSTALNPGIYATGNILLDIKIKLSDPLIPVLLACKLRSFDHFGGSDSFLMEWELLLLPGSKLKIIDDDKYNSIHTMMYDNLTTNLFIKKTLDYTLLNNPPDFNLDRRAFAEYIYEIFCLVKFFDDYYYDSSFGYEYGTIIDNIARKYYKPNDQKEVIEKIREKISYFVDVNFPIGLELADKILSRIHEDTEIRVISMEHIHQ